MKISFEIVEKENGEPVIQNILINGNVTVLIIAALPHVLGRIMGGIVRDYFKDPMAKVKLPKHITKVFLKSMEDEIHGTEPMIDKNLVREEAHNEHS